MCILVIRHPPVFCASCRRYHMGSDYCIAIITNISYLEAPTSGGKCQTMVENLRFFSMLCGFCDLTILSTICCMVKYISSYYLEWDLTFIRMISVRTNVSIITSIHSNWLVALLHFPSRTCHS